MKREEISRAVGEIDASYIEEAAEKETIRPRKLRRGSMLSLAACAAIVIVAGAALHGTLEADITAGNSGGEAAQAEDGSAQAAETDGNVDSSGTDSSGMMPDQKEEKRALVFNEAALRPAVGGLYELDATEFIPMEQKELLAYFQAELPIPEIIPDLRPVSPEEPMGIYGREQRLDAVYRDMSSFVFANDDGSRRAGMTLSKVSHAVDVEADLTEEGPLHLMNVNGRELVVFQDSQTADRTVFYVQWMQADTGWRVWSTGLSDKEFLQLLSTLVMPENQLGNHSCEGELLAIDQTARHVWIQPENGNGIGVNLPERIDMDTLCLYDHARVTWRGEPATLGNVWAEQMVDFTPLKGVQP